jgi:hypothetical protein
MSAASLSRLLAAGLLAAGLALTAGAERAAAQNTPPVQTTMALTTSRADMILFGGPVSGTLGSSSTATFVLYGPTRVIGAQTGAFALQYTRTVVRRNRFGIPLDSAQTIVDGVWYQTFFDGQGGLAAVIYGKVSGGVQDVGLGGQIRAGLITLGGTGPQLLAASGLGSYSANYSAVSVNNIEVPVSARATISQQTTVQIRQPFQFK